MWWEPIEKGAQKLSQRLIELTEIKPGQRVLDVATGIGEPSIAPTILFYLPLRIVYGSENYH